MKGIGRLGLGWLALTSYPGLPPHLHLMDAHERCEDRALVLAHLVRVRGGARVLGFGLGL